MTTAGWITAAAVFAAFAFGSGMRPPWHRGGAWVPRSPLRRLLFCAYGAIAGVIAGLVVSKWQAYFAALSSIE